MGKANRIFLEVTLWLASLVTWLGYYIVVMQMAENHANDSIMLLFAVTIVLPLLFLVSPFFILYSLAGPIATLVLSPFAARVRYIGTAVALAGLAILPPAFINYTERQEVERIKAGDMSKAAVKPQPAIALILPPSAQEDNGDAALCGVYCLKLLYSGETVTVLVGRTPDAPIDDVDVERLPLMAYTIARGRSCPLESVDQGRDGFQFMDRAEARNLTDRIRPRSLNGECLIRRPATGADATLIIIESDRVVQDGVRNAALKLKRVKAYERARNDLRLVHQETFDALRTVKRPLVIYRDLSPTPGAPWMERLRLWRSGHLTDRFERQRYLRDTLYLDLALPKSLGIAGQRRLVEAMLDKPGPVSETDQKDLDQYLELLRATPPSAEDIALLRRAIRSNISLEYAGLPQTVAELQASALPILPDLLTAIEARVAKAPIKGSRDQSVYHLSDAVYQMPDGAVRPYSARLIRLIPHLKTQNVHHAVMSLGFGDPRIAIPALAALAEDKDHDRVGLIGLCIAGPFALPAKALLIRKAVKGDSSIAWLALERMGARAEAISLRDAEPRKDSAIRTDTTIDASITKRSQEPVRSACNP